MHDVRNARARSYARSPVARWHIAVLVGAIGSLMACDGPTLLVGTRKLELDASQTSDAGQARDGSRVRPDANVDAEVDEEWDDFQCNDNRDCNDNARRRRCNQFVNRCVECFENQNCSSRFCFEGLCRDPDKPRP